LFVQIEIIMSFNSLGNRKSKGINYIDCDSIDQLP